MKFLIDMPLSKDLAAWLRERGHDAVHAIDLGLETAPDTEIVSIAKAAERTIVTADLDYPRLLAIAASTSPSLILFRDGNWRDDEVVARMGNVLRVMPESDIAESIVVVERDRIRRRRLPIGG